MESSYDPRTRHQCYNANIDHLFALVPFSGIRCVVVCELQDLSCVATLSRINVAVLQQWSLLILPISLLFRHFEPWFFALLWAIGKRDRLNADCMDLADRACKRTVTSGQMRLSIYPASTFRSSRGLEIQPLYPPLPNSYKSHVRAKAHASIELREVEILHTSMENFRARVGKRWISKWGAPDLPCAGICPCIVTPYATLSGCKISKLKESRSVN